MVGTRDCYIVTANDTQWDSIVKDQSDLHRTSVSILSYSFSTSSLALILLSHLLLWLSYFFLISSSSSRSHTSFSSPPHPLALILLSHLLILSLSYFFLISSSFCLPPLPLSGLTLISRSLRNDAAHYQSQGRHWSSVSKTILVISLNDDTGHQSEGRHWLSV